MTPISVSSNPLNYTVYKNLFDYLYLKIMVHYINACDLYSKRENFISVEE